MGYRWHCKFADYGDSICIDDNKGSRNTETLINLLKEHYGCFANHDIYLSNDETELEMGIEIIEEMIEKLKDDEYNRNEFQKMLDFANERHMDYVLLECF